MTVTGLANLAVKVRDLDAAEAPGGMRLEFMEQLDPTPVAAGEG